MYDSDADRTYFLRRLRDGAGKNRVQIKAWCLMENHFHLLVKGDLGNIGEMMHALNTSYALRFNKQCGHVGHVFQGRYHSTPIKTDEQLLETVRYIHLNPVVEGLASLGNYAWSSFPQYMGGPGLCELDDMRWLFGSAEACRSFHEKAADKPPVCSLDGHRHRVSDAEAARMATARFGKRFADEIPLLSREHRRKALRELFDMGISERQIERLTGIGRNIIQRAHRS